ncbi:MAG TPA: LCP family protein [Bacillota bacterium]|nr:LCP family protein [Bacillota bacterium]
MQLQTNSSPGKTGGLKAILFILFIIAAIVVLALLINHYFLQRSVALKTPMTILLVGEDSGISTTQSSETDSVNRSDALVLLFLDPGRSKVSLVSIPGNCQVTIPGAGTGPIKDAGAKGGALLIKQALEALTNSKINHYLTLNYNGFKRLIDMVGGVEIEVPFKMYYTDRKGNYITGLEPGRQILNGEKALLYVRYLDRATGEVGRLNRQQEFIKALAGKAFQPGNILDLVKLYNVFQQYTKTDLTVAEALQVAKFLQKMNPGRDLDTYALPGHPELSLWQPDLVEIDQLIIKLKPIKGTQEDLK